MSGVSDHRAFLVISASSSGSHILYAGADASQPAILIQDFSLNNTDARPRPHSEAD